MSSYEEAMHNRYGDNEHTSHPDFDSMVVYSDQGGTPHGRYTMRDGVIDRSVIASARAQWASSSHHRHNIHGDHVRRETEEELCVRLASMEQLAHAIQHSGFDYKRAPWDQLLDPSYRGG